MSDGVDTVEINSANPVPDFHEVSLRKTAVSPIIVTVGSSESLVPSAEILVRGDLTQKVTVPINLHRERMIQENLFANRGATLAETTNTQEG